MTDFTEEEIALAMEAHECTREEAVSTYAAQVRAFREAQRPILQMESLRAERDRRLALTDWWANSDVPMTEERRVYRQALRDITNTYTSIHDVVWPTKPA